MPKILVLDDDLHTRQLYVSLLTPFGHEVILASDGKEGLEQAQRTKPDLIISDILMPTMNGYEFVASLRQCPPLKSIPVIFHSASFLGREARSLGASCGVSLFILKPCEPESALAVIHEALGLKGVQPAAPELTGSDGEAIPLLIDAFYERGKQLDTVSRRLAALLELGKDFAQLSSVESLLEKAGQGARKILGANYAGVGILSGAGVELRSFILIGAGPEIAAKLSGSTFDGPVFGEIIGERKSRRAFSAFGEPLGLDLPAYHPRIRSFLGAPIESGNNVYGWIYVADKLDALEFTEQDAHVLRALAAKVGLAYENERRFRTIEEHAKKLEVEIDERKRAEHRFRMLVETSPTGIVIVDENGRIADLNSQTLGMFGYQREELVGKKIEMLLPDRLQKSHETQRAGYLEDPHPRPMGLGIELFGRRKNGAEFPVEISLGPLTTQEGVLVSAAVVDITARKKLEEQLRLSQRLEAIGKLAGGVAHDFNNLLAVILGCADVALEGLPEGHPIVKKVEMIRQAGTSAADLTRQLLAFSRQQMLQPRVLDLKEVVQRTQALLRRLIGENIELALSVDPALGLVKADPGQIEQVLINLAVNARDAMSKGGRLTIEACNVELDNSYKEGHQPVVPGSYVMFAVADTGCGIDRKIQARVFDPFFTTKELGKGTGLGLATVYGIIKQSGGYIWVYSEIGQGTVFKVYLPRFDQAVQPAEQETVEGESVRSCETILLAEDSESLREMAMEYLESVGYTVIPAASGKEALEKAEHFAGLIHVLLTDVVMPELSGPELVTQLKPLRPGLKVIFTSGYTDDTITRQGILDPSVAFIQKPYRPKALARKIREVLDEVIAEHTETVSSCAHAPASIRASS